MREVLSCPKDFSLLTKVPPAKERPPPQAELHHEAAAGDVRGAERGQSGAPGGAEPRKKTTTKPRGPGSALLCNNEAGTKERPHGGQ